MDALPAGAAFRRGPWPFEAEEFLEDVVLAVFRYAFERWVAEADGPALTEVIRESLAALQEVTAAR